MDEIGREHRAGARARRSEHDSHEDEHGYLRPAAPELHGVHQAKKQSGDENSQRNAHFPCEHRIKIAAENGFLEEWSDANAKSSEPDDVRTRLKQLLNRQVLCLARKARKNSDQNRQSNSAENAACVNERGGTVFRPQRAPTQRCPERRAVVLANHQEKKKENHSGPQGLKAYGDASVVTHQVHELSAIQMIVRDQEKFEDRIEEEKAADGEPEQQKKFPAAPRSADVLGEIFGLWRGRRPRKLRRSTAGKFCGRLAGAFALPRVFRRQWIFRFGEVHRARLRR